MEQEKIGKFIQERRKEKKLTQEELAEKLSVNNKTISRWENGKNMPDVSMFKPLCQILEISVEELINGEKSNEENLKVSYEKAIINTLDNNIKNQRKISKLKKYLILLTIIIFLLILSLVTFYRMKYPKIDIYSLNILKDEENKLNEEFSIKDNKIYFFGISSLQISDINNNYFDLKSALTYKQLTIDDLKKYLEMQTKNGNLDKYYLDSNNKIYKNKKYEIIICNTNKNKDIYIGTNNILSNLKGQYCGKKIDNICYFTRTYNVLNISDDDSGLVFNVTLKEFQGSIAIVKINKKFPIEVGKNYEFTFYTYETFDSYNIENIFKYSTLTEVKETDKIGLAQINDKICVN